MQQGKGSEHTFSPLDPARLLNFAHRDEEGETRDETRDAAKEQAGETRRSSPLERSAAYAALRRMPVHLRTPLSDLEELVLRDCICTWYNYHSFGEQSLPNEARFSIDHAIGSVYAAMEHAKSADMAAELLLAAASVLLVTLRYKRLHPDRAPIFSSDQARIQALREALDRVLKRHGRREDGACDLLRVLLREIVSKQIWNVVCGIGQPDFINQKIVEWDEKSRRKAGQAMADAQTPVGQAPFTSSSLPGLPTNVAAPDRGISSAHARTASPLSPRGGSDKATPSSTSASHPSASVTAEPLTTQPKAVAMPMSSSTAHPNMTPPPLPSRGSTPANALRSSRDDVVAGPPRSATKQTASPHVGQAASAIPPRTPQALRPTSVPSPEDATGASTSTTVSPADDDRCAWDAFAMPMNMPPTAHEGMTLPESLRKSTKAANETHHQENSAQMHTPSTSSQGVEGYQIKARDDQRPGHFAASPHRPSFSLESLPPNSSASGKPPVLSPSHDVLTSPTSSSYHSDAITPARSRPPSRTASAASGGIPPAPDLAEVLSSQPHSSSTVGLRDAFEAFLERGGAANRSLFFSPPSAATVAPGEGEALLKLHVGLCAIARLVPGDTSEQSELYREDAASIVQKALQSLTEADDGVAGRPLREALAVTLRRLRVPEDGKVREVMKPVEVALWARLLGLYEYFWKETCTRPSGGRGPMSASGSGAGTPTRTSFSYDSAERKRFSRDLHDVAALQQARESTDLPYEPRKKPAPTATLKQRQQAAERSSVEQPPPHESREKSQQALEARQAQRGGRMETSEANDARSMPPPLLPPRGQEKVTRPVPRHAQPMPPSPSTGPEITVTDVSPNADRQTAPVDLRNYEVMIAVEGVVSETGGFVLLRQWKDFQQLNEELLRSASLPPLPVALPSTRGKTSPVLTAETEAFLRHLLSSPQHMTSEALQYFVDKSHGGERNEDRLGALLDSIQLSKGLDLGRSLASGVGTVGRSAFHTLQAVPGNVAGTPRRVAGHGRADEHDGSAEKPGGNGMGSRSEVDASQLSHLPLEARRARAAGEHGMQARIADDARTASPEPGKGSGRAVTGAELPVHRRTRSQDRVGSPHTDLPPPTPPPAPAGPPTELSQVDLDNLLSCLFAIADEAFNLSGGWTFRRGMLRVFEQIVRTQYWSSLLGVFNNVAHSLNQEQLGRWCEEIKDKFWPEEKEASPQGGGAEDGGPTLVDVAAEANAKSDDVDGATTVPGTTRTHEDMQATHMQAQAILVRHVPASSAYFLGPGGRQSCERAVLVLHQEMTRPSTSLDLVLSLVLKLCDLVAQ